MEEEVLTHDSADRRFRLCHCAICGHVSRCTPSNDFYSKIPGGPLRCEACMLDEHKLPMLDLTQPKTETEA
jgi:hypothetical protein